MFRRRNDVEERTRRLMKPCWDGEEKSWRETLTKPDTRDEMQETYFFLLFTPAWEYDPQRALFLCS
jgi:hypothetical protein